MSIHTYSGSHAPKQSIEADVTTSKYFGAYFAKLDELRALHQGLLEKVGVKCFVEIYQTTLETYVIELKRKADTAFEKDVIRILEDRNNRCYIAGEIAEIGRAHV